MSDNEADAADVKPEDDRADAGLEAEPAPAATGLGDDDDDDDDDGPVVARRRDRKAAVLEDDDADDSDDDSDDDEEDAAARKKKRKAQQLELDEDDYDLLEDNQVTGFRRKEKKKRLQKASDRDKQKGAGDKPKTVKDVERDLFGDDSDEEEAAAAKQVKPKPEAAPVPEDDFVADDDSEDEFADFIEREEGEQPRRKIKSKMAGVRSEQLQDAVDIFGDLGELQELFARRGVEGGEGDEDESEEESEEEEDGVALEDEGDDALEKPEKPRRAKKKKVRRGGAGAFGGWRSVFEPSLVREQMLTARDDEIRREDWPERLQISPRPGGPPEDADAEAKWIFDRMMGIGSVRRLPTFGGDLLLDGYLDDESMEDHQQRLDYRMHHGGLMPENERHAVVASIAHLLRLVHVDGLELTYLAQNLKDPIWYLLRGRREDSRPPPVDSAGAVLERRVHRRDVLHEVMEWDRRYARMAIRKREMGKKIDAVTRHVAETEREDHPDLGVLAELSNKCDDADSEELLDDVEAKLTLRFDDQLFALAERQAAQRGKTGERAQLRPLNRTQYAHHVRKGLRDLLPLYGVTPERLAVALNAYGAAAGADETVPDMLPEEAAAVYAGGDSGYEDAAAVLKGLVHVAAAELSAEPGVRRWLRDIVRDGACVWTQPTPLGTETVDPFHPLAGIKRLQEKPMKAFQGSEFAMVLKAYREGLISLRIALGPRQLDRAMAEMESAYCLEAIDPTAEAWNALRKRALDEGVRKLLVKSLVREASIALEREAVASVKLDCGAALWDRISSAPWRPRLGESHREEGRGEDKEYADDVDVRVLAAVWGPGDPPTTFAMLDASGELVDFLACPNIAIRTGGPGGGAGLARQQADLDRLLHFMIEHRPHVCVVAASPGVGRSARILRDAVSMVVGRIVEDHARAIPEEVDTIKVVFADDTVPALAGNCAAIRNEFHEHPKQVRHAVALGRYLRDPPAVVAALVSGGEAKSLALSPLQDALTEEEKLDVFQRGLGDIINQCGVDVNAAVAHPWMQHALNFIAGLGPRKSGALVSAVRSGDGGALESRGELLAELDVLGPIVFRNAATGLKVVDDDALDATRIHPDQYEQVWEVVANALDYDYEQLRDATPSVQRKTLERAMDRENWDKLAELNLTAYAEYLKDQNRGWLLQTLRELRMELREPYGEIRVEWRELNSEAEFYLLFGETKSSLCPGKIVSATVKKLVPPRRDEVDGTTSEGHVVVQLESGIMGKIAKDMLSDNEVARLEHKVAVGQVVAARVVPGGVDYDSAEVTLCCRSSELSAAKTLEYETYLWQGTPYYHLEELEGERPKPKPRRKKIGKANFIARKIDHPLFQNVSPLDAQMKLESGEVGDVIIRPSTQGVTNVSLTMKYGPGIYGHYDIKEGAKPGVGHTANLALGSPLTVEGVEYEDLDEVYARFVEPIVGFLKDITRHRKFRKGDKKEVDQRLKSEMARHPDTRPYALSLSREHIKMFCLSAILSRSGNVHHEYIALRPEGFRFRKMSFPTVERLLSHFKVNPTPKRETQPAERDEPPQRAPAYPPQSAPYPPQGSAYPPMQPPAPAYPPGGFGAPPPGGGWGGVPPVRAYAGGPPMHGGGYPPHQPPPPMGGYPPHQPPPPMGGYPPQGPPGGYPPRGYPQQSYQGGY